MKPQQPDSETQHALDTIKAAKIVVAHAQTESHKYTVHFPAHGPRPADPHYIDFEHYHKLHSATAVCSFKGTAGETDCTTDKPLELHHTHIEFALTNGVDFATLEKFYSGISDPTQVGAWVESEPNFTWLCQFHHRGHGGAHVASASDFESQKWVKDFIT